MLMAVSKPSLCLAALGNLLYWRLRTIEIAKSVWARTDLRQLRTSENMPVKTPEDTRSRMPEFAR